MGQGKPKEEDIGALWEKSGKGGAYFSGTIKLPDGTKQEIVVFKNRYKERPNQPDWRIYKSSRQANDLPRSPSERARDSEDEAPF